MHCVRYKRELICIGVLSLIHHKSWSDIVIKGSLENALCCVPLVPASIPLFRFPASLLSSFLLSLISHGHTETSSGRRRRRILGGALKNPKIPPLTA